MCVCVGGDTTKDSKKGFFLGGEGDGPVLYHACGSIYMNISICYNVKKKSQLYYMLS